MRDPSNPQKLPECLGSPEWELGWGYENSTDILPRNPNRGSLALVIALLCLVEGGMSSGNEPYTNDAMVGIGPIEDSGTHFGVMVAETVREELIPLRDQEFVAFLAKGLSLQE
jgi:hypothetical protein